MRPCWCGNTDFLHFNSEYGECRSCGTLVSLKELPPEQFLVRDDAVDFYGKKYWLEHQQDELGYPNIHARARNDLTERNLYWLKTLLKYCLPPAKTLELGCSHGSFVALMQQAGYKASGVEMSPWVIDFGQKTFNANIAIGPIETLSITPGSLDAIALMDVLEHLPDPAATMAHCLNLLKPDGLLLIQTPQFKEGMDYTTLLETKGDFLDQLKTNEHLFLFSNQSATLLFQRLAAEHIQFEPALFDHYDMFFVVSRAPLTVHSPQVAEQSLLRTPNGRIAQALLDLQARENQLIAQLSESEIDRIKRWHQIETMGRLLKNSEKDRTTKLKQIETLEQLLQASEKDRSERLKNISMLSRKLQEVESDRDKRLKNIEIFKQMLLKLETDCDKRLRNIKSLEIMLKESEADRAERLKNIESLEIMLKESEYDRAERLKNIESLEIILK